MRLLAIETRTDSGGRLTEAAWLKTIGRKTEGACRFAAGETFSEEFILDALMLAVRGADTLTGYRIGDTVGALVRRLRSTGRDSDAGTLESKDTRDLGGAPAEASTPQERLKSAALKLKLRTKHKD